MKDASGTTSPATIYHTAVGLRKIMPPEMPLWMHTHDTASTAVSCYQAAIHGGADGVDLSCRPLASGTSQPDVRSLAHALKGTGYSLDIDVVGDLRDRAACSTKALKDYEFDPADHHGGRPRARLPDAGRRDRSQRPHDGQGRHPRTLQRGAGGVAGRRRGRRRVDQRHAGQPAVLAAGLQQRPVRALEEDRRRLRQGRARLLRSDRRCRPIRRSCRHRAEQLDLPPFDGDPLEAAPNNIGRCQDALRQAGLEVNDENVFLVLSSIVPGRKMETNEGLRYLLGNPKIDIPLKKSGSGASGATPAAPARSPARVHRRQVRSRRATGYAHLRGHGRAAGRSGAAAPRRSPPLRHRVPRSTRPSAAVEVVDIQVAVGDVVKPGAVVAQVEAMKAKHDIRTPVGGTGRRRARQARRRNRQPQADRVDRLRSAAVDLLHADRADLGQSAHLTAGTCVMFAVAATLIYLAIAQGLRAAAADSRSVSARSWPTCRWRT